MTNHIVDLNVHTHRLSPTEAEVWIVATAGQMTPATELRGRMVGPKCALSSTIEVAYPLRPFPRQPVGLEGLCARVAIAEPSLWEPACPFVYNLSIELWEGGVRCDVRHLQGYRLVSSALADKPGIV
jgi:hypothetical protein